MITHLKCFLFSVPVFCITFSVSCNPIGDSHTQSGESEKYEIDTVINGVHIQQNGRLPTKEDFVQMSEVGKKFYDSLRDMKQEDKDSLKASYIRFIKEEFGKK